VKALHLLPSEERDLYFRTAADESRLAVEIIEKDFWVIWTLNRLFSLDGLKDHLTFKGGTSLSKVYRIIERFSEDIDLSIEKDFLGFDDERDPEKAPSTKKQRAAIDNLKVACSAYVTKNLLPTLQSAIAQTLGTASGWKLLVDEEDRDRQTLLFEYPSKTKPGGYIRPFVKIEIGARAEHWPVSQHKVQSYAKETLKDRMIEQETSVRVLNAERTFWEKATILHQYAHLPDDKPVPPRISRHLYDFFCLLRSQIKTIALEQNILLERVANHKTIYFHSAWAHYDTARKGTLRLSPPQRIHADLEGDYKLMDEMFFGPKPGWKELLTAIGKFEREFNGVPLESKIIVNGRERITTELELSYDDFVKLAFENPPNGPNVLFTITFRNGPVQNQEGTLIGGHSVYVKSQMIFNVTATDKS